MPPEFAAAIPELELKPSIKNGKAADQRHHVGKEGFRFWGSGLVFLLYDE